MKSFIFAGLVTALCLNGCVSATPPQTRAAMNDPMLKVSPEARVLMFEQAIEDANFLSAMKAFSALEKYGPTLREGQYQDMVDISLSTHHYSRGLDALQSYKSFMTESGVPQAQSDKIYHDIQGKYVRAMKDELRDKYYFSVQLGMGSLARNTKGEGVASHFLEVADILQADNKDGLGSTILKSYLEHADPALPQYTHVETRQLDLETAYRKQQVERSQSKGSFKIDPGTREATPIVRIPPIMPRGMKTSGYCQLTFDVSRAGAIENVNANYCTDEKFKSPAEKAVKKWMYTPARKNGVAIRQEKISTRITFQKFDDDGKPIPFIE